MWFGIKLSLKRERFKLSENWLQYSPYLPIYKTVVCDRVCVHSHFIGRMRIPVPHSEIFWHAAIPRQVPEIRDRWSSTVYRLESPNLESSKSHLSPFIRHNPCHSSNNFPNWKFSRHKRVQPFSVFRSFRSRSFESQPSTSTYRRTLLTRRSWPAWPARREGEQTGVEELSIASFCLTDHERAMSFVFIKFLFLKPHHRPEPPGTDKGWEGGVDNTGGWPTVEQAAANSDQALRKETSVWWLSSLKPCVQRDKKPGCLATREKSEVLGNELPRNSQLPSFSAGHWSELKLRHGRHRRSLRRGNTWKLTVTLVLRRKRVPGPHVATHYSEETAAVEKSRKDVETVKWKPHSQVNVTRTMRYRRPGHSTRTLARHSWAVF